MKILHFSDLHLDHAFLDDTFTFTARDRRQSLNVILTEIVTLAQRERVDAITIAGDLFDAQTLMPATLTLLSEALAGLAPIPVLIAPGLSDACHAEALYARWDFPANVHVFSSDTPTAYSVTSELTVWGMTASIPPLRDRLHGLRALPGVNLLLAYAPGENTFSAAQLDYALLGGEHCYREFDGGIYPGSPDALEPQSEPCPHGVVLLDVDAGTVTARQVQTGQWRYVSYEIDLTHCASQRDLEQVVQATIDTEGDDRCLHSVVLTGEPRFAIQLAQLQNHLRGHVSFTMRLRPPHDLEALAAEPTVRGLFVSRFIEQIAAASPGEQTHLTNALQLALQALDGIEVPYNAVDPD